MPNKKLLVAMGIALLILFASIIYRVITDNKEENITHQSINQVIDQPLNEDEFEKARALFLEIEENFHNIVEKIFLLGDETTEFLMEDIMKIENALQKVKEELDTENFDREKTYKNLIDVQSNIQILTEKITDIEN
jgi:hypothetical protein